MHRSLPIRAKGSCISPLMSSAPRRTDEETVATSAVVPGPSPEVET